MTRTPLIVSGLGVATALLVLAILAHGSPPRGAVTGSVSTGRLCSMSTLRARHACDRWRREHPLLELTPVDRPSTSYPISPDAHGRFRIALPPGTYTAWWNAGAAGGSLTDRGTRRFAVIHDRTTRIGTVTPIVSQELDRTLAP
jgi:hypothetical protein